MYKFRSLSDSSFQNTIQILKKCEIYFSKYEELNDPFEYSYYWTTDEDHQKKVQFWENQHQNYKDTLHGKSQEEQARFITEVESNMSAPRGHKMIGADQIGIFCTSSDWDNQVLWSLYADSHRGVCFGFDPSKDQVLTKNYPITYGGTPGEFNLYRGIIHQDVLTRKYEDWRHEKEIRVFHNPGIYRFTPEALNSITFGINAWFEKSNRDRVNELIDICRTNFSWVKIRRVLKDDARYKFRLIEIDLPPKKRTPNLCSRRQLFALLGR